MRATDHQATRVRHQTRVKTVNQVQQGQCRRHGLCQQLLLVWQRSDDAPVPLIRLKRESSEEGAICPVDPLQVRVKTRSEYKTGLLYYIWHKNATSLFSALKIVLYYYYFKERQTLYEILREDPEIPGDLG